MNDFIFVVRWKFILFNMYLYSIQYFDCVTEVNFDLTSEFVFYDNQVGVDWFPEWFIFFFLLCFVIS